MTEKKLAANRRNRKVAHGASPYGPAAGIAPDHRNATLMQRMEDSSRRPLWRLTNMLIKVRNGEPTHENVKNEECSQWFVENKGAKKVLPMS